MTRMSKPIEGSVARIEDQYTLIINRGSDHGVAVGLEFAVMADDGDPIVDPETGDVIGELPTEKLRVRVFEVQPKYSRAETFVKYQPPPVKLPSLLGAAGLGENFRYPNIPGMAGIGSDLAKQLSASGAFDTFSKIIAEEMANPSPVRQQIANANPEPPKKQPVQREVTVNIGDKVRQIVPELSRVT
jgi:hypothetical protein